VAGPLPLAYAEALRAHLEALFRPGTENIGPSGASGWPKGAAVRQLFGSWMRRERRATPRLVKEAVQRFAGKYFPWVDVPRSFAAPTPAGPYSVSGAGQPDVDSDFPAAPACGNPTLCDRPALNPAFDALAASGRAPASHRASLSKRGFSLGDDGAYEHWLTSPLVAAPEEVAELAERILAGRRLFSHEVAEALSDRGASFLGDLELVLDPLVHQGRIERLAGVGLAASAGGSLEWRCRRCLSPKVGWYPCHRCRYDACPQCDDCRPLGISSACRVLYEKPLEKEEKPDARLEAVRVSLPFSLSPFQEQVARELACSTGDALIWAACGSGKTEVTLEVICQTVRRGGRVLFALPRRDVVDQLAQRLKQALPGIETIALRGGTGRTYDDAPLIVSTVHQAVRFCRRFDLIIVDEVDAYPLDREVWLLAALERAKRPGGRIVMMTATPPERLLARIGRGDVRCLTLPGRPHGHPLPVPEIVEVRDLRVERLDGELRAKRQLAWLAVLDRLIRESVSRERRMLLFVPAVRLTGILAELLLSTGAYEEGFRAGRAGRRFNTAAAQVHGGREAKRWRLACVHAGDPDRTGKVAALAGGRLDLLITTSILERGITLPRLDVIVFAADWEQVYDARALVQMAGRVGRSPDDPVGRVVYLARSVTPAMREALGIIRHFNDASRRLNTMIGREGHR